jgi:hypothetical protein
MDAIDLPERKSQIVNVGMAVEIWIEKIEQSSRPNFGRLGVKDFRSIFVKYQG